MTPSSAIAATPWLAFVPSATIDLLARNSALHSMPPGSVLFEQAETPAFGLLLVAGAVELLAVRGSQESLVELVQAPDLLLPAAVLNQQRYLLRARVVSDARVVMIQASALRSAISSDHNLALAILACQAAQFRRQIKHIKNLQIRSAEERVGCYLLHLASGATDAEPVRLPLVKRRIASQLGMTRETFSRILATVAQYGIRVSGDLVSIEDAEAAHARFPVDPLIDGSEPTAPLQSSRN